ncbi:MAG: hypothetical protein P9M12_04550 [Candidatus Aceula lacicola]|nr:hypothetical protein [Candidatus Aceula lacicola]
MQAEQLHVIDANVFKGKKKFITIAVIVFFLGGLFFARGKIYVAYLSLKASTAASGGNFKKAEKLYKEIIALEPNVAEHYWQLGTIYIGTHNKIEVSKQIVKLKRMGRSDLAIALKKLSQTRATRF